MGSLWALMVTIFLSFLLSATAQILYDPDTNIVLCPQNGGSYCVHGSLKGPTLISCASNVSVEIHICNILLSKVLPDEYKQAATCHETSPSAGDALCAFNGTGYLLSSPVLPVAIPETLLCEDTQQIGQGEALSVSSTAVVYGPSTSPQTNWSSTSVARLTRTSTAYTTITVIALSTTLEVPTATSTPSFTLFKRDYPCSNPRTESSSTEWPTPTPMSLHELAALSTPEASSSPTSTRHLPTSTSTIYMYKGSVVPATFSPQETGTSSRVTVVVTFTAKASKTTVTDESSDLTTLTGTHPPTHKGVATSGSAEVVTASLWVLGCIMVCMALICLWMMWDDD
ncbi:hypothetical protein BO86DRAFT_399629 [Aspergillus japonicus CBS 114.51]|uniref:Ig-like domain-containing protein n=1 Tax=Aspergillus japonicus CBS 114.51 TaxID=1448312 RepID=A0A8T8X1J4_ASPJA|nr:hypothetical protein BO86DRAFT_399629 [Aspergillus japonicus CBS 114.51]RAH81794.1 hypothetical protein BO86DRAFT_399629 [Aspergillus japonicus CBS 114.51]